MENLKLTYCDFETCCTSGPALGSYDSLMGDLDGQDAIDHLLDCSKCHQMEQSLYFCSPHCKKRKSSYCFDQHATLEEWTKYENRMLELIPKLEKNKHKDVILSRCSTFDMVELIFKKECTFFDVFVELTVEQDLRFQKKTKELYGDYE